MTDQQELAILIGKRFIQRRDVKAIQIPETKGRFRAGDWFPDTKIDPAKRPDSPHLPYGFKMKHLKAHIAGEATYGHYLLDQNNNTRLLCFDIDINKTGTWIKSPDWAEAPDEPSEQDLWYTENAIIHEDEDLRELWKNRKAVEAREWLKFQLKTAAHQFASKLTELTIPCAVAYSGSKGVHVYGFMDEMPASTAREAAQIVLDMLDKQWESSTKDGNFYKHKNNDPHHGLSNLTVEVYPKQDELDEYSGFGNLVRLPLGKNHKNPKDPCFFLDMTGSLSDFKPHPDPVRLLTTGRCFE